MASKVGQPFIEGRLDSKRTRLEILRGQLEIERSSWDSHWRDLGDHILPRRIRFDTTDTNRGEKKNTRIYDATGTLASRTLRSGMMSGITSPARPWFKLAVPDPDMNEFEPVKLWLDDVTKRMRSVFLRSNIYNSLPIVYGDLGTFGTSAMFLEKDLQTTLHSTPFPIGSYYLSANQKGQIRTFFREFRLTVRQTLEKFAKRRPKSGTIIWDNFSSQLRDRFLKGQLETWVDVCHFVGDNEDFDPGMMDPRFKKWASVYFERGLTTQEGRLTKPDDDRLLRESGFDIFPVLAPRWTVQGQDIYGSECPGMVALGDVRQLQLGEKRVLQAVEKTINPPMRGPAALQNRKASILPGDITYLDVREGQRGFEPLYQINFPINEMELKQQQTRQRIQRAYYEDLFLLLANTDRRNVTATEVVERVEEKLLALGPVLEQLNQDLLDPLIDNTFQYMVEMNEIPTPPPELEDVELKVEYISIMAQAQKLVGISNLERFAAFANGVATVNPEVQDKVDHDQMIDVYGDRMSIDPGVVRSDEQVEEIRNARAEAARQQQVMAEAEQAANTMEKLSKTKIEDDNALAGVASAIGQV